MPHPWATVLKEFYGSLRRYLETTLPLYVKRELSDLLVKRGVKFDKEKLISDKWYYRETVVKAGVNGVLRPLSRALANVIAEVNRIWPVYHSYLALIPPSPSFQQTIHMVEQAIKVLYRLHTERKYPPIPFVWKFDTPLEVKEEMVKRWLGKVDEDVMMALDFGECLYGWIPNVAWLEAFAVYLPSLDIENAYFYLKEANAIIKYFTLSRLFYDLVEVHRLTWDSKPWEKFIKQISSHLTSI